MSTEPCGRCGISIDLEQTDEWHIKDGRFYQHYGKNRCIAALRDLLTETQTRAEVNRMNADEWAQAASRAVAERNQARSAHTAIFDEKARLDQRITDANRELNDLKLQLANHRRFIRLSDTIPALLEGAGRPETVGDSTSRTIEDRDRTIAELMAGLKNLQHHCIRAIDERDEAVRRADAIADLGAGGIGTPNALVDNLVTRRNELQDQVRKQADYIRQLEIDLTAQANESLRQTEVHTVVDGPPPRTISTEFAGVLVTLTLESRGEPSTEEKDTA